MTELFLNVLGITAAISAVILLTSLFCVGFGRRFSSKCKFALWSIIILRLCIPIGALSLTPIFSFTFPEEIVIHEKSDADTLYEAMTEPVKETVTTPVGNVFVPEFDDTAAMLPSEDSVDIQRPVESVIVDRPVEIPIVVPEAENPEADSRVDSDQTVGSVAEPEKTVKIISTDTLLRGAGIVWFCGAVLYLLSVLLRYHIGSRKLRRSSALHSADSRTEEIFSAIATELKLGRNPKLWVCDEPISPMLMGFVNPVVIIPSEDFDEKKLERILRHELVHFKRCDLWMKLACTLASAIHWFNPLVHIASARCCTEMEMSCDEIVLRDSDEAEALSYGEVMLEIAKKQLTRNPCGLSTTFNPKQSAIKERVVNILDRGPKKRGVVIVSMLLALCIFSGMFIGYNVQAGEIEAEEPYDQLTDETDESPEAQTPADEEKSDDTTENTDNVTEEGPLADTPDDGSEAETDETELSAEEEPKAEAEDEDMTDSDNDPNSVDDAETDAPTEIVKCISCEMVYLYRDEPTHTEYGTDHYECAVCGRAETVAVEMLPHNMSAGSCTSPSTCYDCGYVGETTDVHDLTSATCTSPSTCRDCGITVGEMLSHDFAPATTTSPATCRTCGLTEGTVLIPIKIDVSSGLGTFVSTGGHKEIGEVRYEYRIDEISYTIGELQPDGKYEVTLYHKGEKVYDNRPYRWYLEDSYGSMPVDLVNNRIMFGIHVFNGIYCSFSEILRSDTYPEETRIDTVTTIYLYPGEYSLKSNRMRYLISDPAYGADPMATEVVERIAAKAAEGEPERDRSLIDSVLAMKE